MPDLLDKTAIITGSSSGLGRAIALLFAEHGTRLIICADLKPEGRIGGVDEDEGVPTHDLICRRHGEGRAVFKKADVSVSEDVKDLVESAVEIGGRLDIIVNNAGLGVEGVKIHEMEDEMFDRMIRVNLRSVFLGCKNACAQFLKQEPRPGGHRGWIVNTASIFGLVGQDFGAPGYCASKGGIVNLTKQVAVDYAQERIHCNALCPGFARTAMTKADVEDEVVDARLMARTPWRTWGDVREIARGALFLASENAAWVTGVALPVDGGYMAI